MVRPKDAHPTPGELEVLKVLWEDGPSTVREVLDRLNRRRPRAYTSLMSLMNVMTDKGLLRRRSRGRAYVYEPRAQRDVTLGGMVTDLLGRAFEGSASDLVTRLLDETSPSDEELEQIREVIERYRRQQGDSL
jgi:predicted transcriptional regulator